MAEHTTGYVVTLTRDTASPGWARITLRKQFWAVGTGTRSRLVAETGMWTQGLDESAIVEGALRELLRIYADRW